MVTKSRVWPESGAIPDANNAGKIASPATNATAVSLATTMAVPGHVRRRGVLVATQSEGRRHAHPDGVERLPQRG